MTTELIKLTLAFRGLSDEDADDGNVDIDGGEFGNPDVNPEESGGADAEEEEEGAM